MSSVYKAGHDDRLKGQRHYLSSHVCQLTTVTVISLLLLISGVPSTHGAAIKDTRYGNNLLSVPCSKGQYFDGLYKACVSCSYVCQPPTDFCKHNCPDFYNSITKFHSEVGNPNTQRSTIAALLSTLITATMKTSSTDTTSQHDEDGDSVHWRFKVTAGVSLAFIGLVVVLAAAVSCYALKSKAKSKAKSKYVKDVEKSPMTTASSSSSSEASVNDDVSNGKSTKFTSADVNMAETTRQVDCSLVAT